MTNLEYNCSCTLEQKIILFGFFQHFLVYFLCWKIAKTHFFCSRWPVEVVLCWSFLVILAWDNQKGTFWTHFVNFGHEGAPNVTKLTYNMKILWENSHRKKNWGSFVHRGLRYDFLRKKIWTVPLILQFNISGLGPKTASEMHVAPLMS